MGARSQDNLSENILRKTERKGQVISYTEELAHAKGTRERRGCRGAMTPVVSRGRESRGCNGRSGNATKETK